MFDFYRIFTVLITITGTHEISVHIVEYILEKNESSETALIYKQVMVDIEQQMIKQVHINLVIFLSISENIVRRNQSVPMMVTRII